MKKINLLFGILFITFYASAQDIIYKTDGNEIKAKVIEITIDAIKYKNFEQSEGPTRDILISDVFMIIYENGEKEVFKTKENNNNNKQINNNPKIISKNNVSINIVDNRPDKIVIGKGPVVVIQPLFPIKDKKGKLYNYAVKTLENVLLKKGFTINKNSNYTLEIKINELFQEIKVGLYGMGGHVTQNCKASVFLTNNNKILFKKDLNSLYSNKRKVFYNQVVLLNKQYSGISDKKEIRKKLNKESREYSSKGGYFINFIIVFDDIINQLLNDKEFQNIFSE